MKNQLFALIGLGLLLATASAYAQTGVVKANVPFNFIVNKTDLPAGDYKLCTSSCTTVTVPDGVVRYDWTSGPGGGNWHGQQ